MGGVTKTCGLQGQRLARPSLCANLPSMASSRPVLQPPHGPSCTMGKVAEEVRPAVLASDRVSDVCPRLSPGRLWRRHFASCAKLPGEQTVLSSPCIEPKLCPGPAPGTKSVSVRRGLV